MAEMTENEIIEGIKYRIKVQDEISEINCFPKSILSKLDVAVLDLINRKNAEIEKLQKAKFGVDLSISSIRAEAVREFAERLKDYYIKNKRYDRPYAHTMISLLFGLIDDIVKEMVGEEK